jgi:hypothetical protein
VEMGSVYTCKLVFMNVVHDNSWPGAGLSFTPGALSDD